MDPIGRTFSNAETAGAFALAGGASMLASIPFFISSGKNKEEQMSYLRMNQHLYQGNFIMNKILFLPVSISVFKTILSSENPYAKKLFIN